MTKIKWIVINAGSLTNAGDFVKFSIKAPAHCKRVLGVFPFSEEMCKTQAENLDVLLSLSLNNKAVNSVCAPFTLGYNDEDNTKSRMLRIDEELLAGQKISGYVEKLYPTVIIPTYNVRIYLKCETAQDSELITHD